MYSAIAMMYAPVIDSASAYPLSAACRIPVVNVLEEVADAALRETHQAKEDHGRVLPREVTVQVAVASGDEALDELDTP